MSNSSSRRSAFECYERAGRPELASRPWLVTPARTVTFGELHQRIEMVAGLLAQLGIGAGDRIVISTRDDVEAAQLFVALICNSVTAINLDPDAGPQRARSLLAKASPRLALIDRDVAAHWSLPAQAVRVIEIVPPARKALFGGWRERSVPREGLHALLASQQPQVPARLEDPETLAYIMFTSGTTDQPKGVCISHRALFAHLETLQRRYGYGADSRIMNTLMLAHADGMIQGPVMACYAGIAVHRPARFEISSIERLLDALYQLRITHLVAVPTMLSLIQRLGLSQRDAFQGGDFKLLISCGAQLEAALWESFEQTFHVPLVNVYGLTETVVGGIFSGPDADSRMPGSIGIAEDCECRIVDAEGRKAASGELQIRGELLMSGYFEAPGLTAEVMCDGWLRTGDVARRDNEGRFWITGRIKNIIIRGGYNIHPEEITEVLQRHPAVTEAVTLGMPDPVWGETVASVVVAPPAVSTEEILAHCASQLEPRKVPTRIERVQALPRGLSGKVILERARELLHGASPQSAGVERTSVDHSVRVLQVAAACFKAERTSLTLASAPRDVPGWDSLAHLEFISALEKEFGLELSARDIMSLDRLDKALELIGRT